jgi:CRP/FNR family transcriptional regulator, nitrogen oxide reductase regulator
MTMTRASAPPRLLAGLSEGEQRDLLAPALPRLLKPHDVLGHQGGPADLFALIQIGHLKLCRTSAAGTETLVAVIGPGDCYAAIAPIPGSRYPVSAIALEPARVLTWPRQTIAALADRLPRLKTNMLAEISLRMSGVLAVVEDLATERVPQRLARALLRLAAHGYATRGGLEIAHPVTRQELADLTGSTLFTVSRLMAQWEGDGLLRSARGAVTVLDPEGLELVAAAEPD